LEEGEELEALEVVGHIMIEVGLAKNNLLMVMI
jgi:hypothetical protein